MRSDQNIEHDVKEELRWDPDGDPTDMRSLSDMA
jgi:hypothetical protein